VLIPAHSIAAGPARFARVLPLAKPTAPTGLNPSVTTNGAQLAFDSGLMAICGD
jgi:hypothetical protein